MFTCVCRLAVAWFGNPFQTQLGLDGAFLVAAHWLLLQCTQRVKQALLYPSPLSNSATRRVFVNVAHFSVQTACARLHFYHIKPTTHFPLFFFLTRIQREKRVLSKYRSQKSNIQKITDFPCLYTKEMHQRREGG